MKTNSDNIEELILESNFSSCSISDMVLDPKYFLLFSKDDKSLLNILKYIEKQQLENGMEKVCVVSIIGKSILSSMNCKAKLVSNLIGQNVFHPHFEESTCIYKDNLAQIDGYYDINNRIIFLHLTSVLDSWALSNLYKEMEKQLIEKGFLSIWPNLLTDLFKSLIFLFYVSHLIIVTNQTPRFDISCINMFRIIDSLRVKLQPFVSEVLQSCTGLSSNWVKSGRLCIPQLIFSFEAFEGFEYINSSNVDLYSKQLEEQITRILRKSRLISNLNSNSLFTISSSNRFVFISTKNSIITNYNEYFFHKISDRCTSQEGDRGCFKEIHKSSNYDESFLNFILPHINAALNNSIEDLSAKHHVSELAKASDFIKVLLALKKLIFLQTYSDISLDKSRNLQKIFDSLNSTLDIDNRFSESRCSKMVSNALTFYQDNLPSHYTRETHERKLFLTIQHFNLQARGPAIFKYIKIIQSDCENIWNNGRKMCEELSLTGNYCVHKVHRLPHDDYSDQIGVAELDHSLPIMMHNSMVKIISACDCGRRQGNRDDPFTVKAANYDFYMKMKFKCHTCYNITRIKFLVYDGHLEFDNLSSSQNMTSRSEARDSPIMKTFSDPGEEEDDDDDDDEEEEEPEEIIKNEVECDDIQQHDAFSVDNLSNNGDFISSNNEDIIIQTFDSVDQEKNTSKSDRTDENEIKSDDSQKDFLTRSDSCSNEKSEALKNESSSIQSSDNEFSNKEFLSDDEYLSEPEVAHSPLSSRSNVILDVKTLPSMIHTGCPENTPARFSSWSLVCLGPSSIYSHNIGIQDQQGFINGSNFLLPWNVTVVLQHSKNMPPLWEGKRPPGIKHKKTLKDGTQFTVKIFIGVEYECPRGHRFISSGPDQILKTKSNNFKETANKIATSDMPIYMHCICSRPEKSSTLAQLMRIHIVTPKAPIHVTINPFVQMTPNAGNLFFPGNKEAIKLSQSSYWVLRFPMIYEGENGIFSYPKEPVSCCRLLKKCYGIADQVSKIKL